MSLLWPFVTSALLKPRRVAAIDDQRTYTYGQLLGGAMHLAEAIEAATANPHVGLMLPTSGAFPMALYASWLAKRVAVPLNYLLARDELGYVIRDSGIDTIITAGPMLDFLGGANALPSGVKYLHVERADFTGVPPLRWPPVYGDDDLAVILYTSGTSGRPKGVMLTHGNLHSNADAAVVHAGLTQADVFLGVLPQFHSFGLTALTLIPLRIGARVVYTARFVPRKIVSLIRRHKPDIFMAVPSMYGALLSVKDVSPDDFRSIRLAISGGEPLPQATYERYLQQLDLKILEGYGLTETAPVTNWSTHTRHRQHAVGPSLPNVSIAVLDDAGRRVPTGAEGEVAIAGPNIMKGYYKQPDETAKVFVDLPEPRATGPAAARRYFMTGDIGRLDSDGFLFITGRKKEMLIIGGENVFPRQIEEVLNQHPSVKDSAVIGKQDGMRGEVPVAFVELNEGETFDETALRTWCRDRLAQFKVPRDIRHVAALPRNPTGKIVRRALKAD